MKFLQNEPLAKHTSLKVGGLAKLFCVPKNVEELRAALTLEEKKLVIGNGTNLIFSDEGFSGLVICLADFCTSIKVDGETAIAGAGVALNKLVNTLAENELVGLEFLAGIPGTVGGALIMNAGAWGGYQDKV